MIEPISLIATSAALVGTCGKLAGYVYQFARKASAVDTAVGMLGIELDELRRVLGAINTTFNNPELARAAFEPQTGHESQHWENVRRSMSDCQRCLGSLERLFEKMNKEESSFLGLGKKVLKMSWKEEHISLHKQQISAYRQTMEVSLQLITVSSVLKNEVLSTTLSSKLDGLVLDVHKLFAMIRGREQAVQSPTYPSAAADERLSLANLKNCASSAEQFFSTAAEIVSTRSECNSQILSFPKLSEAKVRFVEEWQNAQVDEFSNEIGPPSPTTTFSETTFQSLFSDTRATSTDATSLLSDCSDRRAMTVRPDGRPSSISGSVNSEDTSPSVDTVEQTPMALRVECNSRPDASTARFEDPSERLAPSLRFDNDPDQTNYVLQDGKAKYERGDYAGAEICFEAALAQMDTTSGHDLPSNPQLLCALASCYARLGKVERVEEVLDGDEAPNEWKYRVLDIVLSRYLRDGMWSQANAILGKYRKEFHGKDEALVRLLMDCRRNGAWNVASCIATEHSQFKGKCGVLAECVSACQEESRWDEAEMLMLAILNETELMGDEVAQSDAMHQLAEILVHKKDYSRAKQYCSNSLGLRTKKLGKKNTVVRNSAYLLAKIIFKMGEMGEFNTTKMTLPPKYQECLELELLMDMHPSQAAQQVGIRLLKSIAPETSSLNLESIRSGIKANGVLGLNTRQNDTLLHVFSESGNEIAIELLLKMGARPDTPSSSQTTSLYLAIENNHVTAVNLLLDRGASIGAAEFGLAVEKNRAPIVRLLLERGAVVETADSNDNPLFNAAVRGETSLVNLLLKYRQGPNWPAPSMLYMTAVNGHVDVLQLLLENGAMDARTVSQSASPYFRNPARQPRVATALHECVRHGFDGDIIKRLANPDNINTVDPNGETALHIAASRRFTNLVEVLLDKFADISIGDFTGKTPLHCVVCHSDNAAAQIAKMLLNKSVKVDEKDHHGNTPLHIALFEAKPPSYEIIQSLFLAGADLNATTRLAQNALSDAIRLGRPLSSEITSLLLDHGADVSGLVEESHTESDYERLLGTNTASKLAQRMRFAQPPRSNTTRPVATPRQPSRRWGVGRPIPDRKTTV